MTRIIPRCFLILTFTGILLSTAQQRTSSDASQEAATLQPNVAASESSAAPVEQPTSFASVEKTEGDISKAATSSSSSGSDVISGVTDSSSILGGAPAQVNDLTTESTEVGSGKNLGSPTGVDHSGGLFETEMQMVPHSDSEVPDSEVQDTTDVNTYLSSDEIASVESKTKETIVSEFGKANTEPAASLRSTHSNSPQHAANHFEHSSVPSTEESVYNSSSVDKHQSPGMMMSSTPPSKVQTEETSDRSKSATRKRSLNATDTMSSSTIVMGPGYVSSSAPDVALSKDIASPPALTGDSAATFKTAEEPSSADPSSNVDHGEIKSMPVTTTSTETHFPHTINSAMLNSDSSDPRFQESGTVAELASSGFQQDDHVSPISSAALSTLSEESIHNSQNVDTKAQISDERSDVSTSSPNPRKSPELEVESAVPNSHSFSPVTFDPDGMTHNFSQDPDSVTFSRGTFRVDGYPENGPLSRLEHEDSLNHRQTEFGYVEGTTNFPGVPASSSQKAEGTFKREREPVSPSSHVLLPHDEPDFEKMSMENIVPSTKLPEITNPSPTSESLDFPSVRTPGRGKVILPENDESEEMLNDSPHFVQVQSRPAATTTPAAKFTDKLPNRDLDLPVREDISLTTGALPQDTETVVNDLDFSAEYRSEQSEIRPITATSPFKISDSPTTTTQPVLVESQPSSPGSTNSRLPDTSHPLSNSAPTENNQTVETTTVVLHPATVVAQSNTSDHGGVQDDNSSSTIAGVAVRTSVSVSFPISNIPSDATNNSVVTQDWNVSSNASEDILPLPIPVNNAAVGRSDPSVAPTEVPPTPLTTESSGLRIRKPKLRIGGEDEDESATPRTRKPFIAPYQKPSTTAGPPVSIFKKARTRIASITSSTTARPFRQFSTIRIHYASRIPGIVPGGELVFSTEPVTTTVPTTTETEEPFSDEPFTEQTQGPIVPTEDDVTLLKVAGYIALEKGLRWNDQLISRFTPQYKEKANFLQIQLDRLFRTSPIASRLWKIQIDGFSVIKNTKSVAVDFILYLINTPNEISMQQLIYLFHDKLKNNTFSRFTVDTNRTSFEILSSEPMKPTTEPPEREEEPVIPQWAIAVIVVGAASLIFIVLFAAVAILGRHHMRRRYSSKLNDEDSDRPSDWESKMAAAYENLAADTIYDAEDLHSDTYKKSYLAD